MRFSNLKTAMFLTFQELVRNRIVVLLLGLIPLVFFCLTVLTTKTAPVYFKLVAIFPEPVIRVTQRNAGIVFIGLTTVALLSAFISMVLIQRNTPANRRLILCGFSRMQLVLAKLCVLMTVLLLVSAVFAAVSLIFLRPIYLFYMLMSFLLMGYIYGAYGLMVGALFRRELEGILFVVLLVNIDIGWLQNPLYYQGAQNQQIIRSLPAFFPSQAGMTAAFSDYSIWAVWLKGFFYGTTLLLLVVLIFNKKMIVYQK
ncbi:hypothetical protein JW935_00665 [candidate division KSB1 bacterium]|nr:hypothetical protein [candidate division KSB1 bacterium]